jgi:hypothetical protein
MRFLTNADFAGQNWLITPAALAVGEHPPASIRDQKWLLVLSGIVVTDELKLWAKPEGFHETLSFLPDMAGPSNSGPLNWAISHFSIPKPPGPPSAYKIVFSLEEWAPFAVLKCLMKGALHNFPIDGIFGLDAWRPNHFVSGTDVTSHLPVNNIFTGVNVDVSAREALGSDDELILRVSYNITLLGKIAFTINVIL